jgi:hypothetical protein
MEKKREIYLVLLAQSGDKESLNELLKIVQTLIPCSAFA